MECALVAGVRRVLTSQRPGTTTDFGPYGADGLQGSSTEAAKLSRTWERVGVEPTRPMTAGSHRSIATSARRSPLSATVRYFQEGFARFVDGPRLPPRSQGLWYGLVKIGLWTVSTSRTDPAGETTWQPAS
jgi:hypothetical protein